MVSTVVEEAAAEAAEAAVAAVAPAPAAEQHLSQRDSTGHYKTSQHKQNDKNKPNKNFPATFMISYLFLN